jgi:hypothetical protein
VFIDPFWGQQAATTSLHSLPAAQRAATDIPVMERYKGATNQQQLATMLRFLTHNRMTRLPVATTASQRTVELVCQYGLAHGLRIPDALIAAITLKEDVSLEAVRQALSKIPGSLTTDFLAEREDTCDPRT